MNISIVGTGYVGLVTGACFAELGNNVICVDNDAKKIAAIKKGIIPIYEPGLQELVAKNIRNKHLTFTTKINDGVKASQVIFIAVGTPSLPNGEADLTGIESVAHSIATSMDGYRLIVEKSTVPVETGEWVKHTISTHLKGRIKFDVASNPEFLREGQAINDFMHPDRIVIGVESKQAQELLSSLYRPLNAPIVVTNIKSAELIKHSSNAFLATKISFINSVSRICDKVGADVLEVAHGMGLDKRIGPSFLNAGIGYGGSCFPKDLDAFLNISGKMGRHFEILQAARNANEAQREFILEKVKSMLWIIKDKTVAILGLSFKPDTDDIRNAPALDIIRALQEEGARIRTYDPQSMDKAREVLSGVTYCKNAYDACKGADCMFIATEWNEFKEIDFGKLKKVMKRPLIVDGRNIYDPQTVKKHGFVYAGVGRGIK